jgi:PncC family amidohydrolase
MFEKDLLEKAEKILQNLREKKLKIVTAESCTGGSLSALFTAISGSSEVFDRGFVTYSNQAKIDMLGVSKKTLENFGAVSPETAKEMSVGALKNSKADIAIAITGIAGPKSDDTKKPVGLVYISISNASKTVARQFNFSGPRQDVRKQSVTSALEMLTNSTQIHL